MKFKEHFLASLVRYKIIKLKSIDQSPVNAAQNVLFTSRPHIEKNYLPPCLGKVYVVSAV